MESSRPFTSSLTRRVLNQHLRETNPELIRRGSRPADDNNSDAQSEASSSSNRSSLSWALSRINRIASPPPLDTSSRKKLEYIRAQSNKELGINNVVDDKQRNHQRYTRSSTLDDVAPAVLSDGEDAPSGVKTPTYRTFTRTRSREYLSPTSSRGASPSPAPNASGAALDAPNVMHLSVVLENGPNGAEAESPQQPRKIPPPPTIPAPKLSDIPLKSTVESSVDGDRKQRRVSRFLRPDFYEISKVSSFPIASTFRHWWCRFFVITITAGSANGKESHIYSKLDWNMSVLI